MARHSGFIEREATPMNHADAPAKTWRRLSHFVCRVRRQGLQRYCYLGAH